MEYKTALAAAEKVGRTERVAPGAGEWIVRGVLFGVTWLVTYSRALVMSDDINHLQGSYGFIESSKVLAAYEAAIGGQGKVIYTGLGLDGIDMKQRPLATVDAPLWSAAGYRALFEKYYGVETGLVFR